MRDALVRAWPGVPVDLDLVRDPDVEDEGAPPTAGQQPTIVMRGAEQTVVVEYVRTLPGVDRIRARTSATGGGTGRRTGGSATRCPPRTPPDGGWSRCPFTS